MPRQPDMTCAGCGKLIWRGKTSLPEGQATCQSCRRQRTIACPGCGSTFKPARSVSKYCSRTCSNRAANANRYQAGFDLEKQRERWQRKNRRRRALKRGVPSEPYSLYEIAARDGYRCQLCRRKVNMALSHPHRRSATIDHIVPLAADGDDTRVNVQLAHLGCNSAKCAQVGIVQLALIG